MFANILVIPVFIGFLLFCQLSGTNNSLFLLIENI